MDKRQIALALRRMPVCNDLKPREVALLGMVLRVEEYKAGDIIFREGEPGTCCYFVASGAVELSRIGFDGERRALGTVNEADLFGQVALVDAGPRAATCRAAGACTLLRLERSDFESLFSSGSSFAFKFQLLIARVAARQLDEANRRLNAIMLAASEGPLLEREQREFVDIQSVLAFSGSRKASADEG